MRFRQLLRPILAVCAFALIIAAANGYYLVKAEENPTDKDLASARAYWELRFERNDTAKTYEAFIKHNEQSTLDVHALAHYIGEFIYKKDGIAGLQFCDSSFSYGCYHQFVAQAVFEHGLSIIFDLERACNGLQADSATQCTHGIGHGLLKFTGYSEDGLLEALSNCALLSGSGSYSCALAAFMEYEYPAESSLGQIYDYKKPFALCENQSTPQQFKDMCYVSMPNWLYSQPATSFDEVAALCAKAPHRYAESCYSGIGISLPGSVLYEEREILEKCSRLPSAYRKSCLSRSVVTLVSFGKESSLLMGALNTQ